MSGSVGDERRLAQWITAVNAALGRADLPPRRRDAAMLELLQHIATARAAGASVTTLTAEDPASYAARLLQPWQRAVGRVTPMSLVLTGLLGAVVGMHLVWYQLYLRVDQGLLYQWADDVRVALALDLLAVAILIGSVLLFVWIGYGRKLPGLLPRLALLMVVAALLAWPAVSGYGYTTGYSTTRQVIAVEILIGSLFLVAALLAARNWSVNRLLTPELALARSVPPS